MKKLNLLEATALSKFADKRVSEIKKEGGEEILPGNHKVDFTIHVEGSLSRGEDTKVTPSFSMNSFLKALLLKYADNMDKNKGREWLRALMDIDNALGAVVQLGPDTVIKTVDPALVALYDGAETAAKEKFKGVAQKQDRAGNTVVVLDVEMLGATSEKENTKSIKMVKSAKRKL